MSGTTVCLLRSTDVGAPTLNGTAGSLIALLDACLIDGYNAQTPQSLTRTGDVATVTFATAHNFVADGLTKVLQAGWEQAEYNGIKEISNVTTNSYDFTVTGTPATPGTGTGTSKAAPLGWLKAFAGTNKAAYKSVEPTSTQLYLRVDDANPKTDTNKTALMRGYETMTDVDTGTGLFPTVLQMVDGIYFWKSGTSDATARPWVLVGDSFEFHLFSSEHPTTYAGIYRQFHFGDPASEMASDPYGCLIYGNTAVFSLSAPNISQLTNVLNAATTITAQAGHYFARLYSQIGNAVGASKHGQISFGYSNIGGSQSNQMAYPAPHNNGLYVSPIFVHDGSVLRGQLKGIYQPLHYHPLGHAGLCPAASSPINRRLYAVATAFSSGDPGETHIDIDGPWR